MQVGQLRDLGGDPRAALALAGSGLAGMPHEVVGDQLRAAFERLGQRDRPVLAGQRGGGIHLDHGQPPAGRRDRVAFAGVRLLPRPQRSQLRLEGGPAGHWRHRRRAGSVVGCRHPRVLRLILHDRLLAPRLTAY